MCDKIAALCVAKSTGAGGAAVVWAWADKAENAEMTKAADAMNAFTKDSISSR